MPTKKEIRAELRASEVDQAVTPDIQKELDDANAAEDSTLALLNAIGSGKKKDLSQVLDRGVVQLENGEWAIVSVGPKRMTEKKARWVIAAYIALAELGVTDRAKANVKKKGRSSADA
jgi:hypothetical protein